MYEGGGKEVNWRGRGGGRNITRWKNNDNKESKTTRRDEWMGGRERGLRERSNMEGED